MVPPSFAICVNFPNFQFMEMLMGIFGDGDNLIVGTALYVFQQAWVRSLLFKLNFGMTPVIFGRKDACNIVDTGITVEMTGFKFWNLEVPQACFKLGMLGYVPTGFAFKTRLRNFPVGPLHFTGSLKSDACGMSIKNTIKCGGGVGTKAPDDGPSIGVQFSMKTLALDLQVSAGTSLFGYKTDFCFIFSTTNVLAQGVFMLGAFRFILGFQLDYAVAKVDFFVEFTAHFDNRKGESGRSALAEGIVGAVTKTFDDMNNDLQQAMNRLDQEKQWVENTRRRLAQERQDRATAMAAAGRL
jgi:hypothetical protein